MSQRTLLISLKKSTSFDLLTLHSDVVRCSPVLRHPANLPVIENQQASRSEGKKAEDQKEGKKWQR